MEPIPLHIQSIIGFEKLENFYFTRYREEPPLFLLEAAEEEVSFLLTDPFHFFEYEITLPDEVQGKMKLEGAQDILVLAIVHINRATGELTANLAGPLLINLKTREGTQIILNDERLSTQHKLPITLNIPCSP